MSSIIWPTLEHPLAKHNIIYHTYDPSLTLAWHVHHQIINADIIIIVIFIIIRMRIQHTKSDDAVQLYEAHYNFHSTHFAKSTSDMRISGTDTRYDVQVLNKVANYIVGRAKLEYLQVR